MPDIQGYCFKCNSTRTILNVEDKPLKNGVLAWQGTCEVCGNKLVRIKSVKERNNA